MRERDPMWSLVMFDLPVRTAAQRREANRFRNLLKDLGYCMVQKSVYVKYVPISGGNGARSKEINGSIPVEGRVQITYLTDSQWSRSKRFVNRKDAHVDAAPEQLTIF